MPNLPNPVIVIPGVIATYLRDEYTLPPESIWEVLESSKQFERASLHPDNLRLEAIEPARVAPGQIYEIAYRELVEELRHNLRQRPDQPVPVYPFGYDWRQPLEATSDQLGQFIDEVIARTQLLRHYDADDFKKNPRVNLVGHSMGGLVIAGHLAKVGKNHKIGSIVSLATPFRGSYESVIKVTTGTANLGTSPPSSREREAARVTPALYYLLPDFDGALTVPPNWGLPSDLFSPSVWQASVTDTITQYVQLRGLNPKNAKQQAADIFAKMLENAKNFRDKTNGLDLKKCGLDLDDWLCVVGVDSTTRVRLSVQGTAAKPDFSFNSSDRQNGWGNPDKATAEMTGDGTVPFRGALPEFLPREKLVCVSPDDFGYWEIQDRVVTSVAGFHGILPNMDMLHRLIVKFFTNRKDAHGNIWGRRAPGVTKDQWIPPITGLTDKT